MKYMEDTLKSWTLPLSQTEEQQVNNTVRMIKDAVATSLKLRIEPLISYKVKK